jgi:uncharacterized protein (DUF433 family)
MLGRMSAHRTETHRRLAQSTQVHERRRGPGKKVDTSVWRERLALPAYLVADAARYAGISANTIRNWQTETNWGRKALGHRDKGESLNYFQLVEVAFVAALRRAGVRLDQIKNAREYMAVEFGTEYPFAATRFKTDGKDIWVRLDAFVPGASSKKLVKVNRGGQLAWAEVVATKFTEFDYENDLAVRWHPRGKTSPVFIDPRISFGAPTVKGIATWAIRGRHEAGESIDEIAEDFEITKREVDSALQFEGIDLSELRAWH